MISMQDTVIGMRERQAAELTSVPNTEAATRYKSKLLDEYTDYSCVGTGGWLAWVCPF